MTQTGKGKTVMLRIIIGIVAGAICGFGYYKLVGCSTGTCPITSSPYISTIYGAIMGAVIAGI
ncbi:MAG TPA: hypothetical protein DCO75_00595 [Fibrobacteres bacterium]|nr:hypothetical protein [Fibrobacterota bacterium]